ncbi:MAG TPA: DUF2889 domain-containing protein [Burkholderiaceae bacterium]
MPLSQPTSPRALKHRRAIQIDAFARDDGLWDIEARISDVKTRDAQLACRLRPAGSPVHDMLLRLTIDTRFSIVAAEAVSEAVPYAGYCDSIGPAYAKLVGLNLARGFRKDLQEALGGVFGCTHINELAQILPTAAIQAFAGEVFDPYEAVGKNGRPFQLDQCHALKSDGPAVAKYYPRWAVGAVSSGPSEVTAINTNSI